MVHNCMVNNSAVISYKCGDFLAIINSVMQVESAQATKKFQSIIGRMWLEKTFLVKVGPAAKELTE